ncbi:MBL fold metallo-hydrolase [Micromonospora sp. NPDC048839]|uniref:MBL fold metallo-hydrolase n=1 Tax=Micromonospora sp. NPDC048839 TaxID=3155641 RepID=UPI003408F021
MTGSWMVRTSRQDGGGEEAITQGVVFADWPELGDISQCRSLPEVRARLATVHPGDAAKRLDSLAGQLWRFLAVMSPGDYVAMPYRNHVGSMAIGRIVGRYRYQADAPPGFRHSRAVQWINTSVPRNAFKNDLFNSLGSIARICGLPPDPQSRRMAAVARKKPDPGPEDPPVQPSDFPPRRDLVSVLDVGDGACTIIRTRRDGRESVTVIDCGSDSVSADDACERLLDALDGRPELIETIIVTHFDVDHYLGFVRLAERMRARGQRFRRLRLISPRPPRVVPQYALSYLAMARFVTGVRSLDLALELETVTDRGLRYTPMSRGAGGAFLAGDRGYEVLWPPPILPPGVTRQVQNAVLAFEELARSLADSGNPALKDNFEAARTGGWLQPSRDEIPQRPPSRGGDPGESPDLLDAEDAGEDGYWLDVDRLNIPAHLQQDFRVVWDRMRRANNNMSLVFEDAEPGRLIAFGDASHPVLSWLATTDLSPAHYALMLAPHHGTHPLPASLQVTAELCVAQNGTKRAHLWPRHLATHRQNGTCVSSTAGNHHLLL